MYSKSDGLIDKYSGVRNLLSKEEIKCNMKMGILSVFSHLVISLSLISFIIGLDGLCALHAQKLDTSDVALMRKRVQQLNSVNYPGSDEVQKLLQSMQPDGSWKGIDYYSIGFSPWPPYKHLTQYVLPLAKAYANPGSSVYHNTSLADNLHKALDFWLNHNFASRNWWENDIGVPKTLGVILILMGNEITSEEFIQALNQMRGSYITQTGQNKVWRAEIQLEIGLIEFGRGRSTLLGSPQHRIEQAGKVLQDEVIVQEKEGIQPDGSFHQHGVQQQFGNYGLSFASTQAEWTYVLKGTPYQYSKQKIKILRHYILSGLSRVVWKGIMDISGIGRQIFPGSPAGKGRSVVHVLQLMIRADPDHADLYRRVAQYNQGEVSQPSFLKGNTYFWRSDMMVNRSSSSYISVRMCSRKIQSTESGNGENLLGAHLSDGATYLYQSGKEYKNIFPVWDWHRIPGVTSYRNKRLPEFGWSGLHNGSDFVGGVSDSTSGLAAMLFKRDGLTAYKAWFFVPNGLVCLGAGVNSDQKFNVLTTLNQSLLNGPVTVIKEKKTETLSPGQHIEGNDINLVYHDGVGYLFLQNEQVHVGATTQQGDWQRIHKTAGSGKISRKVFNLWIEQGSQPHGGTYAYQILPDVNRHSLVRLAHHPSVNILRNDTTVQAVQLPDHSLTEIVFYQTGKLELNKHTTIKADSACMLMVHSLENGLKLTVSSPPELAKKVVLKISGHYEGAKCSYDATKKETTLSVSLPKEEDAGKSVSYVLHFK